MHASENQHVDGKLAVMAVRFSNGILFERSASLRRWTLPMRVVSSAESPHNSARTKINTLTGIPAEYTQGRMEELTNFLYTPPIRYSTRAINLDVHLIYADMTQLSHKPTQDPLRSPTRTMPVSEMMGISILSALRGPVSHRNLLDDYTDLTKHVMLRYADLLNMRSLIGKSIFWPNRMPYTTKRQAVHSPGRVAVPV